MEPQLLGPRAPIAPTAAPGNDFAQKDADSMLRTARLFALLALLGLALPTNSAFAWQWGGGGGTGTGGGGGSGGGGGGAGGGTTGGGTGGGTGGDASTNDGGRGGATTGGGGSTGGGSTGGGTTGGGATGGGLGARPPVSTPTAKGPTAPLLSAPGVAASTPTQSARPKEAPRTPTAEFDDLSSWETWWMFNREALLDLHDRAQLSSTSGGDEFLARINGVTPGGRVSAVTLDTRVLPALEQMLDKTSDPELLSQAIIAYARCARPDAGLTRTARCQRIQALLTHAQTQVSESAALALGILGEHAAVRPLLDLARDTRAGRELCARREVPYRTRAFAAYAVGLLSSRAVNEDVRRYAASGLLELSEDGDAPRDVQIACVSALGIVSLPSDATTWIHDSRRTSKEVLPTASREALIAYGLRRYDNERQPGILRAHWITALARLASGASRSAQAAVEDACIDALAPNARIPTEVVQSAALALGQLSDSGVEARDSAAREALMQAAHQADLDTRHFSLLALGQIAARADEDPEKPFNGTGEIHRFLLRELENGRVGMRAFAAVALGLAGHELKKLGHMPSQEASRALLIRAKNANTPDEAAACAIALGLRGVSDARDVLRARLDDAGDDLTRSGCAVGLGLLGAEGARPALRRLLVSSTARPALMREAAVSLALLDDASLTTDLCAQLETAPGSAAQTGLMEALSTVGDARSVEPLLALSADAVKPSFVRARAVSALGAVCDARSLPWNDSFTRGANYLASVETLTNSRGTGVLDQR